MKVKVVRSQTNRSKLKPRYRYDIVDIDYCCPKMKSNDDHGVAKVTSEGVYPSLHGRPLSLETYSFCPWCGEKIEYESNS